MIVRSPLSGWMGGKFSLAGRLLPLFPAHDVYCEPFCGAAWLFFRKPQAGMEVINDLNGDLINVFRMVRDQPDKLENMARWALHSREEFIHWRDWQGDDPVCRAWRFLYLLKCSYRGNISRNRLNPTLDTSIKDSDFKITNLAGLLRPAHERLKRAIIENLPYAEIFRLYDSPAAFFYVDPPYMGSESSYGRHMFHREDYPRLAAILAGLSGKFLLSVNDTPEARSIFAGFHLREITASYFSRHAACKKAAELVISNYPLPRDADAWEDCRNA